MFGKMTVATSWMRWHREPVEIGENRKSDRGAHGGPNTGKNRMPTTPTDFDLPPYHSSACQCFTLLIAFLDEPTDR
jgi:hypothetical protein